MLRRVEINRNSPENEKLKVIYENAFPVDERVPFNELFDFLDKMGGDISAFYDGDILIGMYVAFRVKKFIYGAYSAIDEKLRGKGYGQKMFTQTFERYKNDVPFINDVESPLQANAPNLEIRKRRHTFHKRNGFNDTGKILNFNDVEYTIMSTSKDPVSQENVDEVFAALKSIRDAIPSFEKRK